MTCPPQRRQPEARTFATIEAATDFMLEHGGALHLVVCHDDRCLHGPGMSCTCSPEFVVEDLTAETLAEGAAAQRQWLTRHERN